MMNFAAPRRKPARENVVPMINVVFLLLIFFLMSAQIAPPDPVEITPPLAEVTETPLPDDAQMAWLDAQGVLYLDGLRDADAIAALAGIAGPVTLRVDAMLSAGDFAVILRQLGEAGISDVRLVALSGTP